jgi:hypothetical protein
MKRHETREGKKETTNIPVLKTSTSVEDEKEHIRRRSPGKGRD